MIVHGNSVSPFVRKVIVFAAEKGVALDSRPTRFGDRSDEWLAKSPFGKIPAFEDGDYVLADSSAIVQYIEAKHPENPLIPTEAKARGKAVWFDEYSDTIFVGQLGMIFFNRMIAPLLGMAQDLDAADKAEAELLPPHLTYLETVIPASGFLIEDRLTLADNSFGAAVFIRTIANYIHTNITVEDLNGDGINDIAFSRDGDLTIMTGSQGPTFTETYSNFSFRNNSRSTDFNGDSKKDFVGTSVGSNPSTRIIKIAINAGNNTFSTSELEIPSYYYDAAKYGDFNGDGLQDLLFSAGNKNLLLKNLGNNNFLSQEFRSAIGESISDRVDLDAKVDTISLRRRYLNPMVESEGGQRLAFTSVAFNKNVCDPVGQTKIVDFDGDGTIDRAFWNPTTGYWRRYTPVSQFGDYQQVFFQFGSGSFGDVPVQNDYDGDGRTDYAVYRRSTGTWYVHRSSDQQYTIFRFGIAEDKPVAADYDNDGKADFAVYRPSSGVWYIWLSQAQQLYAARFGIAEDKPVPVDYDGDGRTDIAVYRPSTGVWYRINSSDSSYSVVHYGISSDRPIPADFDGDGKANVAVFRDGVWYVLRSDFSTTVLFYGIAGDIPAFGPGGFNYGDGRETLFTFRRSNNRFYEEGRIDPHIVGDTTNELFVSTVLSAE